MRLWGVPSWPLIEGAYYLWEGCGIFVCMERGSHVDLHMAMRPKERRRCRDAVSDILNLIGNREIHAPIRTEHRQVCNLAHKFDFKYDKTVIMEFLDGSIGSVILMKRSAK